MTDTEIWLGDGERVELHGPLDVHTVADVRVQLHGCIDAGDGDVVVDLTDAQVMDATGLGVLVGAHRRAQRAGRQLVLTGVNARLGRLLLATRLHRVLRVDGEITAVRRGSMLPAPRDGALPVS